MDNNPTMRSETKDQKSASFFVAAIISVVRSLSRWFSEALTPQYVRVVNDRTVKRAEHIEDFEIVFAAAADVCPVVAVQLALYVLFGIEPRWLYRIKPHVADSGTDFKFFRFLDSTEEHIVPIRTRQQREWLDRAKAVAEQHPRKIVALASTRTRLMLERHFCRVCYDIGLTAEGRFKATPSTLRKERNFRRVTEVALAVLEEERLNAALKHDKKTKALPVSRISAGLPSFNTRQNWPRGQVEGTGLLHSIARAVAMWRRLIWRRTVRIVEMIVERIPSFVFLDGGPAGHINFEEVFSAVMRHSSEAAATELALYVFFGIGFGESFSFVPRDDDWGKHVRFFQEGRSRVQPVRTNQERIWLNRAARLAKRRPDKMFKVRVESKIPADMSYWRILAWSVGLTAEGRFSASPSTLREEYAFRRRAAAGARVRRLLLGRSSIECLRRDCPPADPGKPQ